MGDDKDKKGDKGSGGASVGEQMLLAGVVFAAAVLVAPAVLAAGLLYWLALRRLSKVEAGLVAVGAVVVGVLWSGFGFAQYAHWWGLLLGARWGQAAAHMPWLALGVSAALLASLLRLVVDTGVVSGTAVKLGLRKKQSEVEAMTSFDEVVPEDGVRDQIQIADAPGDMLRISPEAHSLASGEEPGKRTFPIAVGKQGTPVTLNESELRMHGLIFGSTGAGKALDVATPIPTPDGWTTMGDLAVGDVVFDETGAPCRVTFATGYQHGRTCYELVFSDGSTIVADAEHRWLTESAASGVRAVTTTEDIRRTLRTRDGRWAHRIDVCAPLRLPAADLPTPPRELGASLGRDADIPAEYLRSSARQRAELLGGLIGDDVDAAACSVSTSSAARARQVRELLSSLGVASHLRTDDTAVGGGPATFRIRAAGESGEGRGVRHVVEVRPVGSRPVKCIQVDSPSHLYLAGETMIPTHNTEAIKTIAGVLMDLGWDGLILDHKEDVAKNGLRDWCEAYATGHARPYQQIYLSEVDGSVWFNPIGGMGADEARDTILAAQSFPDAFWEAINRNMLGQIIAMIYDAYRLDPQGIGEPAPLDIAAIMRAGEGMRKASNRYLATIAAHQYPELLETERANKKHNREEEAKKKDNPGYQPRLKPADLVAEKLASTYTIIYNPSKDEVSAGRGFAARMESVYSTEVGRNVLNMSADQRMFDVTAPGLTYVGLDSQGKPDLTRIISASVMRRVCVLASQRIRADRAPKQKFIIIDEANVVDRSSLMELLSRARSAGITVIAATQGPLDYNMNLDGSPFSGPGFQEIAQNINVLVAMSQGTPEQAEILAEYIGMAERALLPNQATTEGEVINAGGIRVVKDYVVSPEQLRDLRIGEAIVRVGKPRQRVAWAQFKMRVD